MFNIKKLYDKPYKRIKYLINDSKHNIPLIGMWSNSVYNYNKNTIKPFPISNNFILRIIKNYFNLFTRSIETTTHLRHLHILDLHKSARRSTVTKIIISKIELKHTNDQIIINLYIFNMQKIFYLNKINRLRFLLPGPLNIVSYINKLKTIEKKTQNILHTITNEHYRLNNIKNNSVFHKHYNTINVKLIKMSFKLEKLYLLFKRNLFVNNYKLKSMYITPLVRIIEKFYKKKLQFNIVSLKYPYLDSNIYLQLLMIKLRSHKNRVINVINKSLSTIKILQKMKLLKLSDMFIVKPYNQDDRLDFWKIRVKKNKNKSLFLLILNKHTIKEIRDSLNLELNLLKYIRNKTFIGLRIEASGRLTKRITASRSFFKIKHKGGIKNIESSFKGISTTNTKGYLASNLDFDKSSSITRIGSYGLKSWVNSL